MGRSRSWSSERLEGMTMSGQRLDGRIDYNQRKKDKQNMKTFEEFIKEAVPILLKQLATKIENETAEGVVVAYWAGSILRIDLKPR